VSNDVEIKECYVGSTTNFRTRKNNHKTCCNNDKGKTYNYNVYQFIRSNGGWDSFSMVMVEEFKHDTKLQLRSRERHFIESLRATLNKTIPNRTGVEYRADNLEIINAKDRIYHHDNREVRNRNRRNLHQVNKEADNLKKSQKHTCECGGRYTTGHKARHMKSAKHLEYIPVE
tara:strand:+ start:919 stop:1437 length:519 start_codon:yes stop_codon:yes gene_type:complete